MRHDSRASIAGGGGGIAGYHAIAGSDLAGGPTRNGVARRVAHRGGIAEGKFHGGSGLAAMQIDLLAEASKESAVWERSRRPARCPDAQQSGNRRPAMAGKQTSRAARLGRPFQGTVEAANCQRTGRNLRRCFLRQAIPFPGNFTSVWMNSNVKAWPRSHLSAGAI